MTKKTIEQLKEFFKELDKNLNHFSISDYIYSDDEIESIDQGNAFDDMLNLLDENGAFNIEIIYYSNAIEYLAKNDPSLIESLELAGELGYEAKNLNSETLASLLASQEARIEFNHLKNKINEFFITE